MMFLPIVEKQYFYTLEGKKAFLCKNIYKYCIDGNVK